MAFRHPLDPPVQWAAAERCGKLVAQGILEAEDIVPLLYDAAVRAGYQGHHGGLRARLAWHVRDTAAAWQMERREMVWRIVRRIDPLFASEPQLPRIIEAAHAVNDSRGAPLLDREVVGVVHDELLKRVRTATRARRHA